MFSSQTKYIVNLLLNSAHRSPDSFMMIDEISDYIGIPRPYLRQLVRTPPQLDYIATQRGPGGGIRLAYAPDEIYLRDLLNDLGEFEHQAGEDETRPRRLDE
jgi:Rrf2 family iron-sulfur cluster assembly transcriptional regulator